MCTVSYVPQQAGSWLLTSNRDESPMRETQAPTVYAHNGVKLLYPRDSMAGGSWIAISEKGRLGCVLNGAFVPHERHLPYRRSRGMILLDLFDYEPVHDFFNHYPLDNVEPFTMVVIDSDKLYDLRWDGDKRHLAQLDTSYPHIWASATLYPLEYQEKRKLWFEDWLMQHPERTRENLLDFHLKGGEGNAMNDLVMNRFDFVKTVSITSVQKNSAGTTMQYHDLLSGQTHNAKL